MSGFECNASYFIMLAHKVRRGCWRYCSKCWMFLPILLHFVAVRQIAAEKQSEKMASDMEESMKKRDATEFLHAPQIAPTDILWHLLNIYRDQTVSVKTLRQWVVCFSSGNSDMKDKPHCRLPCTAVTSQNEEHLYQLMWANQLIVVTILKNIVLCIWEAALPNSVNCALCIGCSFHGNRLKVIHQNFSNILNYY